MAFVPQFIDPVAPFTPQFPVMIATFVGLGGVNALGVEGDGDEAVASAVDFIANLRQPTGSPRCPWDAAFWSLAVA